MYPASSVSGRSGLSQLFFVAGLLVAICQFSSLSANGQAVGATVTGETATPIPGVGHDYIHLLSETVDPSSGQVHIQITPPMPKGRGLTLPLSITYNSGGVFRLDGGATGIVWTNEGFSSGHPYGQGGWGYSGLPMLQNSTWTTTAGSGTTLVDCNFYSNYTFTDSSGVGHNLNLGMVVESGPGDGNGGNPILGGTCGSAYKSGGDSQVEAVMPNPSVNGPGTVTVQDSEGTVYVFPFVGYPTQVQDRNGNELSNILTPTNGYPIGYTDTAGRAVSVRGTGESGTEDTMTVGGLTYKIQWTSVSAHYQENYDYIPPPPGSSWGCPSFPSVVSGTENVVSAIILPNSTQYTFSYNSEGLLSKIEYPDGGWVEYTWAYAPTAPPSGYYSQGAAYPGTNVGGTTVLNGCLYEYTPPYVTQRQVSFNGSTPALTQTFEPTASWTTSNGLPYWNPKTNTVTTTDGLAPTTPNYTTTYTYSPALVYSLPYSTVFTASYIPLEQSVATTDWGGNLSHPLDTEIKNWGNQYQLACDFHQLTTSGGTLTSGHFYQYTWGQVSDDKAYDFPTGAGAAVACAASQAAPTGQDKGPDRETVTSFATTPFSNSLAYGTSMQFDFPASVIQYDHGVELAETDYAYDGQLTTSPGTIVNQGLSTRYNSRGNVTKITKVCIPNSNCSENLVTNVTYDVAGRVLSVIDPCANPPVCADMTGSNYTTYYSWTDSYESGYGTPPGATDAYLTQVTNPLSQNNYYKYRYSDGQLASSKDPNSLTTTYSYSDPLARLTEIAYPDGGETLISYNDTLPSVTTSKLVASGSPGVWISTTAQRDGMGHVIETELTTDPDGTDYTTTSYYGTGQIQTQSVPSRSLPAPATTYWYDSLNRKIEQLDADNSSTQFWCYNGLPSSLSVGQSCNQLLGSKGGAWVDSVDENGNDWQHTSDSFGNLIDVMEPNPANPTHLMETVYWPYDALNNLEGVKQNGNAGTDTPRSRSFTYDSFSRLVSSTNPESGTDVYAYDANGNVSSKTDARGVIVSYQYDNLNRLFQKTYNTNSDPTVCMQYDVPVTAASDLNPKGQLTMDWIQPAGTTCVTPLTSPPAFTAVPASAIASTVILSHDNMERVTGEQQCPVAGYCSTPYVFNYQYDVGGDIVQANNGMPSSPTSQPFLIWGSTYNGAERLDHISVAEQSSAFNPSAYLNLPSLFQAAPFTAYDAWGHLTNANLGLTPSNTSGTMGIQRTYNPARGWIVSEDDGGLPVVVPPTGSVGSISVSGSERSGVATGAYAKATITLSGMEESKITYPCGNGMCPTTVYDLGTITATINGIRVVTGYGQNSTSAGLASSLASSINTAGVPVTASASGSVITLTAKTIGSGGNSITLSASAVTSDPTDFPNGSYYATASGSTLTGGITAGTKYDAGTAQATITDNSVIPPVAYTTAAVNWGQGDTPTSLASNLAAAINTAAGSLVNATSSGAMVSLLSTGTGDTTNYQVSVTIVDTAINTYPTLFPNPPSFSATANNMQGGEAPGFSAIYQYTAGYQPNGNLAQDVDSVMGAWTFAYDPLNRLTSATAGANVPATYNQSIGCFGYDSFGNRTLMAFTTESDCSAFANSPTATYSANNQVTFVSQGSPSSVSAPFGFDYDPAGNVQGTYLTPQPNGALDPTQNEYAYDGEGRLCAVFSPGNGNSYTGYIYNAEGARVASGSLTSLSCNLATNGFTPTKEFLLGLGGDQVTELNTSTGPMAWAHSNIWVGKDLTATYDTNALHFHLTDPLGTRRVQASASGALEESYQSLPFGDAYLSVPNPNCLPVNNCFAEDPTEHHFTGKERDAESGNDYFGARYYASSMGRWLSPDPAMESEILENPQTWNRYSYVYNRPLYGTDPDGRCPPCVGAIIGGVVGGAVGGLAEGGFSAVSQYVQNGSVNWNEVGAEAAGGAVSGAITGGITGGTGGLSLFVDAGVSAGANVVGTEVTNAIEGKDTSAGDVLESAVAGYAGGMFGHVAADVVHVPPGPTPPNNLKSYLKMKKYNEKLLQRNVAKGVQTGVGTASGTPPSHGVTRLFSLWDEFWAPPPPPPPPAPPSPPGGGTGTIVGCQTLDGQPCH